ncbi:MAG: hypothetical protein K0M45_08300 [Candidatus Paracaedibacteraceae bacterium]|nr:hypothetical protein [Candidatus Paracaedibacteraceae bacterium]
MLVTTCFSQDFCQLIRFDFFYHVKILSEPCSEATYISRYAYPPVYLEENLYNVSQKDPYSTKKLEYGIWGANYLKYYDLEAALLYKLMEHPKMLNRENLSKFRATMLYLSRDDIYDYITLLINRLKTLEEKMTLQIDGLN